MQVVSTQLFALGIILLCCTCVSHVHWPAKIMCTPHSTSLATDLLLAIISPVQDYNFTEFSSMVVDKLETLLPVVPIMNKLMSLHQPGMMASHPATSCSEIFNFNPQMPLGYYWLEASNGSAICLYCNMTLSCKGVGGG